MTINECRIEWKNIPQKQWDAIYQNVRRAPLLQSWLYGDIAARAQDMDISRGIIRINNRDCGLVQIMQRRFAGSLIHALALDNGPVFLPEYDCNDTARAFFDALAKDYPRRPGRKRRILPNITNDKILGANYRQTNHKGYQTIWLGLDQRIEDLRKGLRQKWRNILNKAERSDLEVAISQSPKDIDAFIKAYRADKAEKGYRGADPAFLKALAVRFARYQSAFIFSAKGPLEKEPAAAILVLCHGRSATYVAGWNGHEGRKKGAHHLLLWQAVTYLKAKNYRDFDLGGINETDAQSVKKFKDGLGGTVTCYAGFYN